MADDSSLFPPTQGDAAAPASSGNQSSDAKNSWLRNVFARELSERDYKNLQNIATYSLAFAVAVAFVDLTKEAFDWLGKTYNIENALFAMLLRFILLLTLIICFARAFGAQLNR